MVSLTEPVALFIGRPFPLAQYHGDDAEAQLMAKTYDGDLGAIDVHLGMQHTTGVKFLEGTSLMLPIRLLQSVLGTDGIEYEAVFLRWPSETRQIAEILHGALGDRFDIRTYEDETWNPFFVGTMNFLYVMAGFFLCLILGAVALTLANTTTLNLLERTREIGTIRAIGFPPGKLKALFRRESVLLSLFGTTAGWILAFIIALTVNNLDIRFHPPGTQGDIQFLLMIDPALAAIMGLLIFMVTWLATEFVVRKKSREKIVLLLAETGA
jgi:putative ABC transport system permease protein